MCFCGNDEVKEIKLCTKVVADVCKWNVVKFTKISVICIFPAFSNFTCQCSHTAALGLNEITA